MKKNSALFVAIVGTTLLAGGARAVVRNPPSQSVGPNTSPAGPSKNDVPETTSNADIQMLRKDLRSQKKQIVAANMDLTDAQAEKFWPVYDQHRRFSQDKRRKGCSGPGICTELRHHDRGSGGKLSEKACCSRRINHATETQVPPDLSQSTIRQRNSIVLSDRLAARPHDRLATGADASN